MSPSLIESIRSISFPPRDAAARLATCSDAMTVPVVVLVSGAVSSFTLRHCIGIKLSLAHTHTHTLEVI